MRLSDGRVKIFVGTILDYTGPLDVSGGAGGVYGSAAYGVAGDEGSFYDATLAWQ